jgi:GNAT superfamily N-acetyltransferase
MNIRLIVYEDRYAEDFKRLNLEWLDKYNLTESHDLMVLNDPRGTIINRGGVIYLIKAGDEIVGSAALMKEEEGMYELAKMAVAPEWRGKGLSKILLEKCLETARSWKIKKVSLFSNSQLQTALQLYRKYGFRHAKVENAPYSTADVRMELNL